MKPALSAEDADLLTSSFIAIGDGQLLATKPPPPHRLRDEIYEGMLFPFHARVDVNPKLQGVPDHHIHPPGKAAIGRFLSSTLSKAAPFTDNRVFHVKGRPIDHGSAQK